MTAPASLAELRPGDTWEDLARALLSEVERLVLRVERLEKHTERGAWPGDSAVARTPRVVPEERRQREHVRDEAILEDLARWPELRAVDAHRLRVLRAAAAIRPGQPTTCTVVDAAAWLGMPQRNATQLLGRICYAGAISRVLQGVYDLAKPSERKRRGRR
jgi:hypothetical protein